VSAPTVVPPFDTYYVTPEQQHDGPVTFFGGEEAFKEVQRRDARKRRLCSKRGVQLIEVRPGYNLEHLLERVRLRRDSCCN
jgi:hypothetical protein